MRAWHEVLFVAADPAASRLDTRALRLRYEAPFPSGSGGLGLLAPLRPRGGLAQQGHEAGPRLGAIAGLSAMLTAVDHEHSISRHPVARQPGQPGFHVFGQRYRGYVEAQF